MFKVVNPADSETRKIREPISDIFLDKPSN